MVVDKLSTREEIEPEAVLGKEVINDSNRKEPSLDLESILISFRGLDGKRIHGKVLNSDELKFYIDSEGVYRMDTKNLYEDGEGYFYFSPPKNGPYSEIEIRPDSNLEIQRTRFFLLAGKRSFGSTAFYGQDGKRFKTLFYFDVETAKANHAAFLSKLFNNPAQKP